MSAVMQNVVPTAPAPNDVDLARVGRNTRSTAWSVNLPGFGLRIDESGREAWMVHIMQGRLKLVTLGSAAVLSATEAHKLAWEVLAQAHVENDPASARKLADDSGVRRVP